MWLVCGRLSHSFLADRCGSMVFAIEGFCWLIVADHCSHPPLTVVSTRGWTVAGLPWLYLLVVLGHAHPALQPKVPNPKLIYW